jgi:ribose 5-phosphate isomerase B
MKISVAADHAGFELKTEIINWLNELGYQVIDFGTKSADAVDYPDFAYPAAKYVASGDTEFGILICGTGTGMCMTANKVNGIRAANCCSAEMAHLAREHNNANVLTLGARLVDKNTAKDIINEFLNTNFEGGRHNRRINKIHAGEVS